MNGKTLNGKTFCTGIPNNMTTPFSVGIPENDFFSLTDILNSFDTPSVQRQPQLKRKRIAIEDPADDPTFAPTYTQPNIDLFSTNDATEFFSKNQEPQTAEDFMKHFILRFFSKNLQSN